MSLDGFTRSHWYAIGRCEDVPKGGRRETRLLGKDIVATRPADAAVVRLREGGALPVQERYGHVWTTLAEAPRPLFDMPEFGEPGRRLVTAGAITVRCSGLRAIENFLDMAHFPFVHTDVLGTESHAGVAPYQVELRQKSDEIWATSCRMFQPRAAAAATDGQMTEYMYRVAQPFSAILYKTCPIRPAGVWDLIGLFVQPREPDLCDIHSFVLVFDNENTDVALLHFQQMIFIQDRRILENQVPALLPLDARAEAASRADLSSMVYRRWLMANGLRYGAADAADSRPGGRTA
jgi:phenylpropionate dioxygenase-like ring-hydroxylating dioxygenase large terminal subunit